MPKSDIVLVKPNNQKALYGVLSDYALTAIEPPLWGAIWAGFLRKKGYAVHLIDAEALCLSQNQTAKRVAELDPLVTVVVASGSNPSASTMTMAGVQVLVEELRSEAPDSKILLAGLHPSALPEQTLRGSGADYVCQGEGFFTLAPLLDSLKSGRGTTNIPGLWLWDGDHVHGNSRPELLYDLDQLPLPAWDLLPMPSYRAHNWHCFDNIKLRAPYAVLYTSLGCPFQCSFCCINSMFGKNTIRYRGLNKVIEEIELLVREYDVRNIKIMDEMFAMNEKRIITLCDMIIERKLDLNIWAYARVDTVTRPMLSKFKQAGINWLAYGFESGSKKVLSNATKGYKTDQVMDVVQLTKDNGIHICANYMFGLPEDDYSTMNETLKLMLDINSEWANIYCTMAYPGSRLYKQAVLEEWPLPKAWTGFSQHSPDSLPLPTRHLSGPQVLSFRDYAFDVYFKNPRYLHMINRIFGEQAMLHIQEMAAKSLPRNNLPSGLNDA